MKNQISLSVAENAMKQKDKFTPGPWTVAPAGYDLSHRKSNHWRITAKSPHLSGKMQTVCELNGPWDEGNYAANARLIAAAPELIAELEKCLAYMEADSDDDQEREDYATVRAAIAKARGE